MAEKVAEELCLAVAIPAFRKDGIKTSPKHPADFDDLRYLEGSKAVRMQLDIAIKSNDITPINVNILQPVEQFDANLLLPSVLREFVTDLFSRLHVPPEFMQYP